MADIFDTKTRSRIMSRIRSKNTEPELELRRMLRKDGFHFSTYSKLPGTPDIVFKKIKLAIFVDGEFWHGHNWLRKGKRPKSKFWRRKLLGNVSRDKKVDKELHMIGWKYVRVLDSQVFKQSNYVLSRIRKHFSGL
jgi:DNA mismatch endonuclease (patch repair protein)